MRKILEIGGFISGAILIAFGAATLVLAMQGRNTVNTSLTQQKIVGEADMTPSNIAAEAKSAGLTDQQVGGFPKCSVANVRVSNGNQARCFAQYMQIHALEASGGLFYSELPRYLTAAGKGTNDASQAQIVNGKPIENPARNTWVTETALTSALNMSYMAEQLSLFSLVVGVALLLTGIGFVVLDFAALHKRRVDAAAAAAAAAV